MKFLFLSARKTKTFYAFVSRFAVQDKITLQMFYDYFVCRFQTFLGRLKKSKWLQKLGAFQAFAVDSAWESEQYEFI